MMFGILESNAKFAFLKIRFERQEGLNLKNRIQVLLQVPMDEIRYQFNRF